MTVPLLLETPLAGMNRRSLMRGVVATGLLAANGGWPEARAAEAEILVKTRLGVLKGRTDGTVNSFKGIAYGDLVTGTGRFLPPKPAKSWDGIRDASHVGPTSPQMSFRIWWTAPEPEGTVKDENCLVLNVWAPATASAKSRPVMVWLHGGGFSTGSGSVLLYDGANLAREGDVIVVTLNHRLNIFGFLHLGDIDPKFAGSGNAGMLDIVEALRWVRDNIAVFGGDPGNVTIFGESGGGQKVGTLLAMPSAKGLFHKAIQQSGPALTAVPRDHATEVAKRVLDHFQLGPTEVHRLQDIPADRLLAAPQELRLGPLELGATIDGSVLSRNPFEPDAPAISAHIPLLIGTNQDEGVTLLGLVTRGADIGKVDEAGVRTIVARLADAKTDDIIAAYRASRPQASPSDLLLAIGSDILTRIGSIAEAERKAALGKAPVFMYLFSWQSPVPGMRATHGMEIPFVFDNIDAAPELTGQGEGREALAKAICRSWAAFAHTGNPSTSDLPAWPAYDGTRRATMILDRRSKVVNDPGGSDRLALVKAGLADWSPNDLTR
jgi:para-nitrobenzyl esterase